MHKLADYAKPHFEKLLVKQRREAVEAINKIKSDTQDQYNKELKDSRNKIALETAGAFLKALASQDNKDPKKVRGLKTGILVRNRDTGMLMHVLPNQYLLYKGDTKRYFLNSNLTEKTTANEIGSSFYGAYINRGSRLKKVETKASETNPHNKQFPIYRGTQEPNVDDFATGEIGGVFEGEPVLLSKFEKLPVVGITNDMIMKMEAKQHVSTLPALTFSDAEMMVPDVTEGDINDTFKLQG